MKFHLVICSIISVFFSFCYGFSRVDPGFFKEFSSNKCFVETGSYLGDGIKNALESGFDKIYSIEISEKYYEYCKERFSEYPNVYLFWGDSSKVLQNVIGSIQEPITFWLDGHYSSGETGRGDTNTPLLQELIIIKNHPIKTHTIIIDDIRCLSTKEWDYIPLSYIIRMILSINPDYKIAYRNGYIKNDVLVAKVVLNN